MYRRPTECALSSSIIVTYHHLLHQSQAAAVTANAVATTAVQTGGEDAAEVQVHRSVVVQCGAVWCNVVQQVAV